MAEKRDDVVSDFVNLNMNIYRGAVDMWAGWMKGMVRFTPLGLAFGESDSTDDIVLEGEKGKPATAKFTIRNPDFRSVTMRISTLAHLKSADGKDGPHPIVKPDEVKLGPWEKREIEISVEITDKMEIGKAYSASVDTMLVTKSAKLIVTRTK